MSEKWLISLIKKELIRISKKRQTAQKKKNEDYVQTLQIKTYFASENIKLH